VLLIVVMPTGAEASILRVMTLSGKAVTVSTKRVAKAASEDKEGNYGSTESRGRIDSGG
jgi:hypothetical protein